MIDDVKSKQRLPHMASVNQHGFNDLSSLLSTYLEHFLDYPHSLIVKYLGLYSVKVPGEGVVRTTNFHLDTAN